MSKSFLFLASQTVQRTTVVIKLQAGLLLAGSHFFAASKISVTFSRFWIQRSCKFVIIIIIDDFIMREYNGLYRRGGRGGAAHRPKP
jgi:hypothetical protein